MPTLARPSGTSSAAPAGGDEQLLAADGAPVVEREHDLGSVTSDVGRTVTRIDLHALTA